MSDEFYMKRALTLARKGTGWVSPNPMVGAVIVKYNRIIAEGWHQRYGEAHAEINAIRAAKVPLEGATLYVTLEPCVMCSGAMIQARLKRCVYGALEPKSGAHQSVINVFHPEYNHQVEVEAGVLAEESGLLLKTFFKRLRKVK